MREHLHVTRQHDQGALMLAHQSDLFLLRLTLVFFADRYDEIRHSVEVGDPLVVGVFENYQRNIAMQFATLLTVEQVLQAMVVLRDENGDARPVCGAGNAPVHLELTREGRKTLGKFRKIKIEISHVELNPRQKQVRRFVSVLVVAQDVAVVFENKIGNRCDYAFAVGTRDEKDGGIMHRASDSVGFLRSSAITVAALQARYFTSTPG